MKDEIQRSIEEATRAIEQVNRVFDRHAEELRKAGNEDGLKKWMTACYAMRDSGNIYITWARHYAKSTRAADSSIEEDFLDDAIPDDGEAAGSSP